MRAAIYARMSTDKQSADSPADQIARCREFAKARCWCVVEELVIEDAGISGASRHERPQFLELMARIAEWDTLLCWDFSRLARNEEDLAWTANRLASARKNAIAVSTGRPIHDLGARIEGVISAEYLCKLKLDTHRGLLGRAERGLATGGLAYGYRSEQVEGGGSRWVIDPEQAAVVRSLFQRYLAGEGLKELAHSLNARGVPPPRPRANHERRPSWSPSAIREMLLNPVYKGEVVWIRSEWIKDHETGRKRRFERPESEWIRREVPELAIVEPATSEAVCAELARRGGIRASAPPRRSLLSGLLVCATCGGGFTAVSTEFYACSWRRNRGEAVCATKLLVKKPELEGRILGALTDHVLSPANVRYAVDRAFRRVKAGLSQVDEVAPRQRSPRLDEIEEFSPFPHGRGPESTSGRRGSRGRSRAGAAGD